MSAKLAIPARMEPSALTLWVVTPASVLQTSRENIVTKVFERVFRMNGIKFHSFGEIISMTSNYCVCI